MTPFLEYELLSPETADPVIIRLSPYSVMNHQEWFHASNRVSIYNGGANFYKAYDNGARHLVLPWDGKKEVTIPLSDWPAVKQAIRELNEYYGETNMKEDRYEFPLEEWDWNLSPIHAGNWVVANEKIVLTRKKPRVTVEYSKCSRFGDGLGEDGINFERHGYGMYYIVQFRVTGDVKKSIYGEEYDYCRPIEKLLAQFYGENTRLIPPGHGGHDYYLHVGLDARDKWSAPVLLPESIYQRLDEITKALEDRANGGKGC